MNKNAKGRARKFPTVERILAKAREIWKEEGKITLSYLETKHGDLYYAIVSKSSLIKGLLDNRVSRWLFVIRGLGLSAKKVSVPRTGDATSNKFSQTRSVWKVTERPKAKKVGV